MTLVGDGLKANSHIPCCSHIDILPRPCHSLRVPNAGKSPTCSLWTAVINSHIPCRSPALALRGRFQNGIFVAWQGNGMGCVNEIWSHCVNQMGKTQSKPLAARHDRRMAWERHGICESTFTHQCCPRCIAWVINALHSAFSVQRPILNVFKSITN
jgi:hypothetical protein